MEGFTGKNEAITFKAKEPETAEQPSSEAENSGSLAGEGSGDGSAQEGQDDGTAEAPAEEGAAEETSSGTPFMVFDSSGTLRYDAHVVNGQVVDGYGNLIDGCTVDENGNVVDAYWNVIDPNTGQLAQ